MDIYFGIDCNYLILVSIAGTTGIFSVPYPHLKKFLIENKSQYHKFFLFCLDIFRFMDIFQWRNEGG